MRDILGKTMSSRRTRSRYQPTCSPVESRPNSPSNFDPIRAMRDNGLLLFRSCLKITLKARSTHLPTKFPEEPMIKSFLIENLPQLGRYKRYLRAARCHYQKKRESYSQHREDLLFLKKLQESGCTPDNSSYVDIGSNHPSDLSNTYLLYRHGFRGILVDANSELCKLCEVFRPGDIVLNIGAGDKSAIMDFYVSKTPVLSTFNQFDKCHDRRLYKKYRLPIMRMDDALVSLLKKPISLLSVDVESLNLEVLRGCEGLLSHTYLVCIEYDDIQEKTSFEDILKEYDFYEIDDNGCNVIYQSRIFSIP